MKSLITVIFTFLIFSCSQTNSRIFEFIYEVQIDPADGKIEMWIPIPQSNEVQKISNINIDSVLRYKIKYENAHNNKYLYIFSDEGIAESSVVTLTFDVERKEHSEEAYKNVDPDNYLSPYKNVPIGKVFKTVIDDNKLSNDEI